MNDEARNHLIAILRDYWDKSYTFNRALAELRDILETKAQWGVNKDQTPILLGEAIYRHLQIVKAMSAAFPPPQIPLTRYESLSEEERQKLQQSGIGPYKQ